MWIYVKMLFIPVMRSCIFSIQCHMIFRNHNNTLLKKHFWLSSVENSRAARYFCGNGDACYFSDE